MKNIFKVLISLSLMFITVLVITNIIYNKSYKNTYSNYNCCPDDGINYEFPCSCEQTTNIFKQMIIVLSTRN